MARIHRKLDWSSEAISDAERLFDFLDQIDPDITDKAASQILNRAKSLRSLPYLGRSLDSRRHIRETNIPFGQNAYILQYEVGEDSIVILRVWHSKEDRHDQDKTQAR